MPYPVPRWEDGSGFSFFSPPSHQVTSKSAVHREGTPNKNDPTPPLPQGGEVACPGARFQAAVPENDQLLGSVTRSST